MVRTSPDSGLDNKGARLMYALSSPNAWSHSAVQVMLRLLPLSALKNGAQRSVALEINLVRAATRPVRL
ncbi:unnamed protein product [Prunus armeniaca]